MNKKQKKTLSLSPPPPSELILTAGFGLMGSPYPPSLLTFFRAGVRYRIFFLYAVILSATSAAFY